MLQHKSANIGPSSLHCSFTGERVLIKVKCKYGSDFRHFPLLPLVCCRTNLEHSIMWSKNNYSDFFPQSLSLLGSFLYMMVYDDNCVPNRLPLGFPSSNVHAVDIQRIRRSGRSSVSGLAASSAVSF